MPSVLDRLPNNVEALKSLVANQATTLAGITARNEQLAARKPALQIASRSPARAVKHCIGEAFCLA